MRAISRYAIFIWACVTNDSVLVSASEMARERRANATTVFEGPTSAVEIRHFNRNLLTAHYKLKFNRRTNLCVFIQVCSTGLLSTRNDIIIIM